MNLGPLSHSSHARGLGFALLAGLYATSIAPAPGAPPADPEIIVPASVRATRQRVPKYDNGRVILFNRSGVTSEPLRLDILAPGASPVTWNARDSLGRYLSVSDVAIDRDGGGVAATGAWTGSEDREFRLYVFDPQGHLLRSFSTNPYACHLVTLDSTGAIVCFGAMGNRDDNPAASSGVFRRYSREGNLLWESVARSSFPGVSPPSSHANQAFSFLTATAEGVAAYNAPTGEWIELGQDGAVLSRQPLETTEGTRTHTFARLEDGRVYFQDSSMRLYRWSRSSAPAVAIPDWKHTLRGAFGNRLAVEDWTEGTGRVRLVEPPPE